MLDSDNWMLYNTSSGAWVTYGWFINPANSGIPFVSSFYNAPAEGNVFVIDPLALATTTNPAALSRYPYPLGPTTNSIPRLTLDDGTGTNTPMGQLLADRIFTWQDDELIELNADDPDRRPEQVYLDDTGAIVAYSQTTGNLLHRAFDGAYSWFATVTPALNPDGTSDMNRYNVSIVVCYRRDLQYIDPNAKPATERLVNVTFPGGGYGGGDAALSLPGTALLGGAMPSYLNPADTEQVSEYLSVRQNRWMLVYGWELLQAKDPSSSRGRWVAKWYRVVIADDELVEQDIDKDGDTEKCRSVTLAGPDWDIDNDGNGQPDRYAYGVLMDNVLGVYTKTIELDRGMVRR
ncbi:MAG: hypothetical protein JW818_13545, partial [Pirellulales bacterium]|nr:hypothetical protein [Pirellulales bacterium]